MVCSGRFNNDNDNFKLIFFFLYRWTRETPDHKVILAEKITSFGFAMYASSIHRNV